MTDRLTKPVAAVLERCFIAEADISRPDACRIGQWRKVTKPLQKALDEGYVEAATTGDSAGGFSVIFTGYVLTHRGRMAYGKWCSRQVAIHGWL